MAKAKQNLNLKIQMLMGKGTKAFFERFYKNLTSLVCGRRKKLRTMQIHTIQIRIVQGLSVHNSEKGWALFETKYRPKQTKKAIFFQTIKSLSIVSWNGCIQMKYVHMKPNYPMEENRKFCGDALFTCQIGELLQLIVLIFQPWFWDMLPIFFQKTFIIHMLHREANFSNKTQQQILIRKKPTRII